jgi:hypothetical protein
MPMGAKLTVAVFGVGVWLTAAVPVVAHHAFAAEFDANQPVTLKGAVTKVEWTNPHIWIFLDVKGSDGKVVSWAVEGGAPNALYRRGFNKNSLPPGTEVVMEGYRAKDGSTKINGRTMTFADGRTQFLGSSGTGAPSDGKDPSETKPR